MTWRVWAPVALCLAACAHLLGEIGAPEFSDGNRYETLAEARAAQLFVRGWFPDVLPKGTGPIVETHDLDSGARCARAVFPNERRRELVTALLEYGYDSFSGEALPPQRVCPFPVSDAARDGERFRNGEAKASEASFAIVGEGVCYLWSAPQR